MQSDNEAIRILHVDDEPDFADMAATFLEREDDRFDIETATSASEGLDRLASTDFDCVVSDYDMPGQNGIEFLEAVREEHPDLPFVLYTGKGSEEVASEAISAGVTDYLQKEGGTDQYKVLANRISNVVESYRSQQRLAERNRDLRQYKYMINSMHEAACIYDEDGRFVTVNEYLATWYDTTREALEGQQSNLIPSIREQAEDDDPYQALLDGERDQLSGEVEYDFPDHGYAVLAYRLTPLMVDGSVEGVVGVARDVTDQKEREQELYRTKRAMDEAPVGITITNPDREDNPVIYANERFQELTGYSETEILGRNCRFLQGEATDPEPITRMREAIDNEERVSVELRNYRKDGTEFWNRVTIAPVTDENGAVTNYVGFQQDVTERKAREREYERVLELRDHTEQIADVGGWEINPETQEVFWSDHLFEMLGMEHGEEPPLEEALDVYVEEDRPRVESAVEEALAAGEPFDVEARFERADGELRWFQIQGEPTVEDGEVVTLRGAVQDITEQKEREQQRETTIEFLRSLYEVATDRTLNVNEKITRLLELGPEKLGLPSGYLTRIKVSNETPETGIQRVIEASGNHELLQPGNSCPLSESYCRKTIKTDEVVAIQDALAAGWSGDPAYELFNLGCYIGTAITVNDDLYGTVFFASETPREDAFTDADRTFVRLVSRLVSYELERDHARHELEQQNERLEEFASIVSHDLRNPLNVAQGRLELAQEECESEHLDDVENALERSQALIDDLLTLARDGNHVDDIEAVALGTLTESCWHNVATGEATISVDIDRTIRADQSRLQQLLENLYRNAIEHGGDDVAVTVGALSDGFYIEDDGPGIPADERNDVFDAGYSTSEDGTGFGLSIVQQIADAHGWDIRVTDGSDGGARFEITGVEFADE